MEKEIRYLKTCHFNLALYLLARDQQLVGINPVDGKQKEFIFERSEKLNDLENIYKFGGKDDRKLLIQVHKYESVRKELLDRLND